MNEPTIALSTPSEVTLEKGKKYAWCSCGQSDQKTLCDGNHKTISGIPFRPVVFEASNDEVVWLCNCKQTKNPPYCDGSHHSLPIQEKPPFSYYKKISNELEIMNTKPIHAFELENLQHICFPTLAENEIIHAPQYLHHLKIYPEGQFVVLHKGKVVGSTSTMRYNFDFSHPYHKFIDIVAEGWLTTHEPRGEWLYGQDMGIHPDFRGKGLSRIMYQARHDLVNYYHLKGQITVGMMQGYGKLKDQMTGEEYFEFLKQKKVFDPTLSIQMSIGFEPLLLIPNYLDDPVCGNYGVLIVLDAKKTI